MRYSKIHPRRKPSAQVASKPYSIYQPVSDNVSKNTSAVIRGVSSVKKKTLACDKTMGPYEAESLAHPGPLCAKDDFFFLWHQSSIL